MKLLDEWDVSPGTNVSILVPIGIKIRIQEYFNGIFTTVG